MISNIDIEDFERDMNLPLVGVFSKDRMPVVRQIGDYYINLQNHDEGNGTHWVFFKIMDGKKKPEAIYFDPFGVYMPEQVRNYLKPYAPIAVNNRQIQHIDQETCGRYCMACSYYMNYDYDTKKTMVDNFFDFINMFSDNQQANNKILKEYLFSKSAKK